MARNAPPSSVKQQPKKQKLIGVPFAGCVCPSGVMSLFIFFLHAKPAHAHTYMLMCMLSSLSLGFPLPAMRITSSSLFATPIFFFLFSLARVRM